MKAQQLHHKNISGAILNSVDPENFIPTRFTAKALNDDSCWDEIDSDFDEPLSSFAIGNMDDDF